MNKTVNLMNISRLNTIAFRSNQKLPNSKNTFSLPTKYWGMSSIVDCYGCNDKIKDANEVKRYVYELCDLIDMKRYGECNVVYFGADRKIAGLSMTQFIETSLISGHFVDETMAAYIDIFSCKSYDNDVVRKFTEKFFGSTNSIVKVSYRYSSYVNNF